MALHARRGFLAAIGGLSGHAAWQARNDPPHLCWDLDHTLLCSVCPMPAADEVGVPTDPTRYFDQVDDDFPFEAGVPNTRTFWRPGARTLVWLCGFFATQHVYTTAQATYAANVLAQLDPKGTVFATVTHRDGVPASVKNGKDLKLATHRLDRALLFDDRLKNFTPQGGRNGVHVALYDDVTNSDAAELREIARLFTISLLALIVPDARTVARWFRSEKHAERFPDA